MMRTGVPSARVLTYPLGISITSTVRDRFVWFVLIAIQWLFSRNRFLLTLERGLQRMPCEGRALNAYGKFRDAGEDLQLAQSFFIAIGFAGRDQLVKGFKQFLRFGFALPFHCLRHHGS